VICSYKATAKLSNVSTSEVQVILVFNREFSHPNYRVFQQNRPKPAPPVGFVNVSYRDIAWSKRNEILKFEICRSDHQKFLQSGRSDFRGQRPESTHKRRPDLKAYGRLIALGGQTAGAVIQVAIQ
jgi:hypothetical protein